MIAPTLTAGRLTLRMPDMRDWPACAAFMASGRARFIGGPRDPFDAWRSFAAMCGHWHLRGFGFWTVTLTGHEDESLGAVGCHFPETWAEREIGWMVWPAAEGRGIARDAALAARRFAYETLGWTTAVSYIDPANTRSIALAERLGARLDPEARHNFGDDTLVYRHPAPPPAPEGRA